MERVALAGDRRAYAELLERHLAAIEAFAMRMLDSRAEAEDITQEVMLRLWLRAGDFDATRARLTTWLHQIAHNLCIDRLRKQARFTELDSASEPTASGPDTDDSRTQVSRALAALPERQRTALVLTYYQSLSNREVADIMGVSVRAMESLLVRARAALRTALEELE